MSIPASQIVSVLPGVISGGGNPLALNGLFLTQNLQMPNGEVLSLASTAAVKAYFGPASAEYAQSLIYFAGYDTSTTKPSAMLFARFNLTASAAFLQSGSLAALTLAQLQAFTGTLTITINGTVETSTTITLTGIATQSLMAAAIEAAFTGTVPVVTWNAVNSTFVFTSPTTGAASTITFATTGTLATDLALTSATGAILSQGAVLDTPASAMNNAIAYSQNWATFVTLWEPVVADKTNFAIWSNGQNNQFAYIAWDTDAQAIVANSTECFGYIAKTAAYNGVIAVSGDAAAATAAGTTLAAAALNLATFVAGAVASINFAAKNGRTTVAFLTQSGLAPTCASQTTAPVLLANGYSFYGAYATANQNFVFFNNGQMPGEFQWLDSFVNQIYLNSQFQLQLLTLLTQIGDIPYNQSGYGLIRAAMQGTINSALNFGSIRQGVTLSAAQAAVVNQAAGVNAAAAIGTQGYYLQVLDPGATARGLRKSPIVNFWYADGGAVQNISLSSVDVL